MNLTNGLIRFCRRNDQGNAEFRRALGDGDHIDVLLAQRLEDARGNARCVAHAGTDGCDDDHVAHRSDRVNIPAFQLESKVVCAEHMLLALAREEGSVAYAALAALGAHAGTIRAEIVKRLDRLCEGSESPTTG